MATYVNKGKTGWIGADAEFFVSRLFCLERHPRGDCLPDLISGPGVYAPRLRLEVKSSAYNKPVLVQSQLQYGHNGTADIQDLFPEECEEPVVFYYNGIVRESPKKGGISSESIKGPADTIQIVWGNQHIVPHEIAFAYFVLGKSNRTETSLSSVQTALRTLAQSGKQVSHQRAIQFAEGQYWQNFHVSDISAFVQEDHTELTKNHVSQRLTLIRKLYPSFDDLKKVIIPGPLNTQIYILAKPEDYTLFNEQVRTYVQGQNATLEGLIGERREAVTNLLSKKTTTLEHFLRLMKLHQWGLD